MPLIHILAALQQSGVVGTDCPTKTEILFGPFWKFAGLCSRCSSSCNIQDCLFVFVLAGLHRVRKILSPISKRL